MFIVFIIVFMFSCKDNKSTIKEPNPCDNVSCNNGTCTVENGIGSCVCNQGYNLEGNLCIKDLCFNFDCGEFGKCIVISQKASCDCVEGYHIEDSTCKETREVGDDNYDNYGATNFKTNHFSGSGNCSMCHNSIRDKDNNDVSIIKDWSNSMMANASKDPLWLAKVRNEINRNPHLREEIEKTCTRCHMPVANVEKTKRNEKSKLFGTGFLNKDNEFHDGAMDGVTCTVCHQIKNGTNFGKEEGYSGNFTIDTFANKADRKIYGKYDVTDINMMKNVVEYTPTKSEHISDAAMCASCHNLKTPFVNKDGELQNTKFPEQMPYTEWKNSDFKDVKSCISCHMPTADGVKIATMPANIPAHDAFGVHRFLGANTLMLSLFKRNKDNLKINSANLERAINDNRKFLKTSASISITEKSIVDNKLNVKLLVENKIGHKLPTGYPSRRIYIHFTVKDDADNIIFESGKTENDGKIIGNDADNDEKSYEKHYNLIDSENKVQIYETIMGNTDDEVNYTLLRSAKYLKDNRLLPKGFNKATVPADVKVMGLANTDENFIGGSDSIEYQVDLSNTQATKFKIEVKLNYQTVSYRYLQDLFKDYSKEVLKFKEYLATQEGFYETIAEISEEISK